MRRSSMMRRAARVAVAATACIAAGVACYGPTEVRLEITTDLPCLVVRDAAGAASSPLRTLVRLGSGVDAPIVAETTACSDAAGGNRARDIGSIVLVPSGDRSARVTVQVTATADGSDPAACGGTDTSMQAECIVARRSFAFIKHTSRPLPIRLYAACKGKVCDATQTCNDKGDCESAIVADDGCTASGCDTSSVLETDAGDAAEAEAAVAVDAADAMSSPLPCTAADGTSVLAHGTASDLLTVNKTKLFFIGVGPAQGSAVMWIDTKRPDAALPLFSVPGLGTVTALAADDDAVWAATDTAVYRYDLTVGGTPKTYDLTATTSLATVTTPVPTTSPPSVLAATAHVSPTTGVYSGGIFKLDPSAGNASSILAKPAASFVATSSASNAFFVFTSLQFGGPALYRVAPDLMGIGGVGEPFGGMASDGDALLFASSTSWNSNASSTNIMRLEANSTVPTPLYAVSAPGLVVVPPSSPYVFFAQRSPDGAIFRGSKGGPAASPVGQVRVASGYHDVQGLAVDDTCVYFWASTSDGDTLNAYPLTRVAPP